MLHYGVTIIHGKTATQQTVLNGNWESFTEPKLLLRYLRSGCEPDYTPHISLLTLS